MPSVHIDVDPAEIGKNMRSTYPLVGDVQAILNQLLEAGVHANCAPWLAQRQVCRQEELQRDYPVRAGSIFPGRLLRLLGQKMAPDAAVCVDVGQNQIWACKHLWLHGQRFMTSGGLGTMGYALPAAVGVKTAQPDRQTVVICGDGSFQMAMNELSAVKAHGLDIKIVLFRNGVLGLVHQIQSSAPYHGPFGVALDGNPDFAAIAAAYGVSCITVQEEDQVEPALEQFLSAPGSCLLIADVDPSVTTND